MTPSGIPSAIVKYLPFKEYLPTYGVIIDDFLGAYVESLKAATNGEESPQVAFRYTVGTEGEIQAVSGHVLEVHQCTTALAAGDIHPFGLVRAQRGWTYVRVARLISQRAREYHNVGMAAERQKIWRWEHRGVSPDNLSQRILADELGVPYEMLETHPWPAWLPTNDSGFMVTTMRVQAGGVQLWLAMAQGKKDLAARGAWMQVWLVPEGD